MSGETAAHAAPKQALMQAADAARHAPSIHNTQPWRWVVRADTLELHAATRRQLRTGDPEGRMMLLSCGTALHHARVALAADGWTHRVDRPAGEPLAVIRAEAHGATDLAAVRLVQMMRVRRTDRRTVTEEPLTDDAVQPLIAAAGTAGIRTHVLNSDQVIELAVLVEQAQKAQAGDDDLRSETADWVGGDRPAGTGIPGSAIPAEPPQTTVAEREFPAPGTLRAGAGHDTAATYAVLYGAGDEPGDWLRAGEALSALWLTAAGNTVTVLPISSPVEVPFTRQALRHMLGDLGFPYLVVRLGHGDPEHAGPAPTPRLDAGQVVEVED
ncbi:Acg family FMN-binding oxidoreductase [Jidongwangia harbinensis]|uniref:Acg family FMN-binding oxidoreductase n=1 Tax=Jidongwangia harbinensis TaxID=2878561 RepID=UPI001CDA24EC|nr:nitroreductase family protein [Jidongwangia harbinensis]MCA2213990.1 nitroreductase [Jidongwangia harbinensis]